MANFVDKGGVALTPQQISELDIASERKLAGTPGAANTATGQAGDLANLEYAAKRFGYVYNPQKQISDATKGSFDVGTPGVTPPATTATTATPSATDLLPGETYEQYAARVGKTPTATVTPNVLTSDEYTMRKKAINEQLNAQTQQIEADYARRLQEQQMAQEEQKATEKAVQFKTGQAGTTYATEQTNKAEKLRQSALDQLLADKTKLIQAAKAAASADDWKAYNDIKTRLDANQEKQDTLNREAQRDLFSQYVSLSNLGLNQSQEERAKRQLAFEMQQDTEKAQQNLVDDQTKVETELVTSGYKKISGPSELKGLKEDEIIRVPNKVTGGTDVYKKPLAERDTQIVKIGGNNVLIDKNTGETIRNLGGSGGGTGGGGGTTGNLNAFNKATQQGVASLQKGEQWGTVFDRIKAQFPNMPNEKIDTALGIEWRRGGAFEEWKKKQYKETPEREFELQSGVWQWLGSEEAQELSNDEKKRQIQQAGFNPEDFGIY